MPRVAGINEVAVVGAGWMGSGIATVCSLGGYPVNLVDLSQDVLDQCLKKVRHNLDMLVSAEEISGFDVEQALARIRPTTDLFGGVGRSDLAIEVVPEKLELKQQVFKNMEAGARPGTILASNASGLPTTQIADICTNPELVVGIHFFEPPIVLKAVEVIRGERTSDETFAKAVTFVESIGSQPIKIYKDRRSFAINFLQGAMRKAVDELIEAGVTTEEEIQKAARHSFGVKYAATGYGSSRGGIDREHQYEEASLDEMSRRALMMLPVAKAARALDNTDK